MKPDSFTNWKNIEAIENPGERGIAKMKTLWLDDIRIRVVEYSADYLTDHWCNNGHIIYCLEGQGELQMKNGDRIPIAAGSSIHLKDELNNPHRLRSISGCRLFIVDGAFLKNHDPAT